MVVAFGWPEEVLGHDHVMVRHIVLGLADLHCLKDTAVHAQDVVAVGSTEALGGVVWREAVGEKVTSKGTLLIVQ